MNKFKNLYPNLMEIEENNNKNIWSKFTMFAVNKKYNRLFKFICFVYDKYAKIYQFFLHLFFPVKYNIKYKNINALSENYKNYKQQIDQFKYEK